MQQTTDRTRSGPSPQPGSPHAGVGKTVLHDIRHGSIHRSVRQDLRDLHDFYLDDEARARLQRMRPIKRGLMRLLWIMEQLILKLSPARRILLLISLFLFGVGRVSFESGNVSYEFQWGPVAFIILLVVLMLELKDKLLARQEIEVGRAVQIALLPDDHPTLPGWEFWLFTRPANDVGGDLVDYLPVHDTGLGLALGDVAGKGLGAALLMAKLQATLRAFVPESTSLADLGARMNAILCRDSPPARFATLVYFEVQPNSGEVRLLNAGHPLPLIVRARTLEQLPPAAVPLGFITTANYSEQRAVLEPGDLLVVYSDGLTEAQNRAGSFFSEERLLAMAPQLRGISAAAAGTLLLDEVVFFAGDLRQSDDLSLILARRTN